MMAEIQIPKKMGRYDDVHHATNPGPDLPKSPRRMVGKLEFVTAAVPDPNPFEGEKLKRQKVSINIANDPLEREHAYHRISNQAYSAGCAYSLVLEIASGRRTGGSGFEPQSKSSNTHEWAIVKKIENAQDAVDLQNDTRRAIGEWAELLLRAILGEGKSFAQVAFVVHHKSTPWTCRLVCHEFREALEALATEWERKGRA